MWLDGCKIGLTVESEEGEVPHLRWSQAPPLPWPRPGSADISHHQSLENAPTSCGAIFSAQELGSRGPKTQIQLAPGWGAPHSQFLIMGMVGESWGYNSP